MSEAIQLLAPQAGPLTAKTRIIGYREGGKGPLLVMVAGMHGNEPAGVEACRRVDRELGRSQIPMTGRWVALAGNLPALEIGRRFIDSDLNRLWTFERVAALRQRDQESLDSEEKEQRALLQALEDAFCKAEGPVTIVDLHTTSGDGIPFAVIDDTLRNRTFAFGFPLPVILGFEEEIEGAALTEYLTDQNHVAVTFEGGRHTSKRSVDYHEAIIWRALELSGLVERKSFPQLAVHEGLLRRAAMGMPRAFEIRYRKAIRPQDRFRMLPGFGNFQQIEEGRLLAYDQKGEIRAPQSGRLIMPLYQELGDDGFFIARRFSTFWLHISALLRRVGVSKLAHLFPGVRRHPNKPGWLLVDPGVARWFVIEIFHLLGFRRHPPRGKDLVFGRRRE